VRKGQVDESVTYFRQAVQLSKTLYPMAFETLWQAGGRKIEILRAITAEKPAALVSLAQYLVEQQQYDESVKVLKGNSLPLVATLPQTNDWLNQLLQAQQPLLARKLWTEIQTSHPSLQGQDAAGALIWDGGFEMGRLFNLPHFAWSLRDSDYARVGYDNSVHAHGLRSLKFLFTGHDTTVLQNELQQRIALIPKRRYRLEVAVKTQELISTDGPRVAIVQSGIALGQSAPIASGTQDWTKMFFEFVAPENTSEVICTIMRIPKFAYDEPTKGTIWFDDFSLTELGN
jgi:hypothetical protein